ncbi:MAG: SDR family oxidoreductase [Chromatiales bacterium]|nr:MAG: SDR family oxidoreductase [Chromatiales bacterium]
MKRYHLRIRHLLLALFLIAPGMPLAQAAEFDSDSPTVLVTGSNRGIGLEFVRQYAALGWNVIATCRRPAEADALSSLADEYANIRIEQLDVLRHDMIDALARKYRKQPIDVLLNNAGFFGDTLQLSGSFFGRLNYDLWDLYVRTNAIGPLKMAEAFFGSVVMSQQKKIMTVSSLQGSIEDSYGEGSFFYRGSKAALNMFMHTLSGQNKVKKAEVLVGLFSPGLIIDDRTRNLRLDGKVERPVSVSGMIEVIDNFTPEMSGGFYKYTGDTVPW